VDWQTQIYTWTQNQIRTLPREIPMTLESPFVTVIDLFITNKFTGAILYYWENQAWVGRQSLSFLHIPG
jgi:hypothetical protein